MHDFKVGDRIYINYPARKWVNVTGTICGIDGIDPFNKYPYNIKLDVYTNGRYYYPCAYHELTLIISSVEDGLITYA